MSNCPHPEKRRYRSKGQAVSVLQSVYRAGRGEANMHVYRCTCGGWHIGHSTGLYGSTKVALKGRRHKRRSKR